MTEILHPRHAQNLPLPDYLRHGLAANLALIFLYAPLTCHAEQNFLPKGFSLGGTDTQLEAYPRLVGSA
jgi:hypothetical protein